MFYEPGVTDIKAEFGLPHDPFKALVQPRPIGWISTLSKDGVANLAPYSFYNALAADPPVVIFSSNSSVHSIRNACETGEFVVNTVTEELLGAMNASATKLDVDEFDHAGLEKAPCRLVKPPRVAAAAAALECKLIQCIDLPGQNNRAAIGQVVGIHLDERILVDGKVRNWVPAARLGYMDYCAVRETFTMPRPE